MIKRVDILSFQFFSWNVQLLVLLYYYNCINLCWFCYCIIPALIYAIPMFPSHTWNSVFKNRPSKILLRPVFHKCYLVHSWIHWPIYQSIDSQVYLRPFQTSATALSHYPSDIYLPKVNNKDTRTTPMASFWCLYC